MTTQWQKTSSLSQGRMHLPAEKIPTFQQAKELIGFIYFYNHDRTQVKTGVVQRQRRHSA